MPELELRRTILESFARTGEPPQVDDGPALRGLAAKHVVVLSPAGTILMAHPFAGHPDGARVEANGRTWWGNCAWDGLGIVAALGLTEARVTSHAITLQAGGGTPPGEVLFHVAVPARHWWRDIEFT